MSDHSSYTSIRLRVRLTTAQDRLFHQYANARCEVWNWALQRRREHYLATKETLSKNQLEKELLRYKQTEGKQWLGELQSQAVRQPIKDLDDAFKRFFNGLKGKGPKSGFPKFKSKRRFPRGFCFPDARSVRIDGDRLVIGGTRIKLLSPRKLEGIIKSVRFVQEPTGKWYVCLSIQKAANTSSLAPLDKGRCIGIDIGHGECNYLVLSNGVTINAPRPMLRASKLLAKRQKQLSRKKKGSRRRDIARKKVAKIHARVANQRKAFIHELTSKLVKENDIICVEGHSIKRQQDQGGGRAKAVTDSGHGLFRLMLEYKCKTAGKHLIILDEFEPTSQICSACGFRWGRLELTVRDIICPRCETQHSRDLNSAIYIRDEGWRQLIEPATTLRAG